MDLKMSSTGQALKTRFFSSAIPFAKKFFSNIKEVHSFRFSHILVIYKCKKITDGDFHYSIGMQLNSAVQYSN